MPCAGCGKSRGLRPITQPVQAGVINPMQRPNLHGVIRQEQKTIVTPLKPEEKRTTDPAKK